MNGFQKFLAGLALLVGLIAGGVIGAAGVGHKFKMIDYNLAMNTLVHYGYYAAIGAGIVAIVSLIIALVRLYAWGIVLALFALAACAGVAYVPYQMYKAEAAAPGLSDISTDTANPPPFVQSQIDIRRAAKSDVTVRVDAAKQTAAYPDVMTLRSTDAPEGLYAKAFNAVKGFGWLLDANDPVGGVIAAHSVTEWFGFTSDVIIRIQPDGGGAKLDMRSASREQRNDAGENAANIRSLLAKVK